jgi:Tfp pilus assembly protein PilO
MALVDDVKKLTPVQCIMIGCGLTVLYYFLMFNNGEAQVLEANNVQAELNIKNARLEQVNRAIENKAAFQKQAIAITKELEQLLKFLPVELDMNEMQKVLTQRLQDTNNKVQNLKVVPLESRFDGYLEQGLSLQTTGTFHSILSFLSAVTQLDRLVDFKTVDFDNMGTKEGQASVQFKTVVSIFSQMPAKKTDEPKQ